MHLSMTLSKSLTGSQLCKSQPFIELDFNIWRLLIGLTGESPDFDKHSLKKSKDLYKYALKLSCDL